MADGAVGCNIEHTLRGQQVDQSTELRLLDAHASGEFSRGYGLRLPLIEQPRAGDSVQHRLQAGDLVQPGIQFLRTIEHFANRSAHGPLPHAESQWRLGADIEKRHHVHIIRVIRAPRHWATKPVRPRFSPDGRWSYSSALFPCRYICDH